MRNVAIVTGGSKGIGLEIAKHLGQNGYTLSLLSRQSEHECLPALKELESLGILFMYSKGDITVDVDRQNLVRRTVENFGSIDVLVNNAGVGVLRRCDLLDLKEDSYEHVLNVNTKGTFFLSQLVSKQMISQEVNPNSGRRGTIINISSISAEICSTDRGEYCVSKAGLGMITKLFALRLAGEHIYVYEIRPGIIETDMTRPVHHRYDQLLANGRFPIARWGVTADVAKIVKSLVSDSFSYTTGSVFYADGGVHLNQL